MLNEVLAAILIALWAVLTGSMLLGSVFVWLGGLIQDFLSPPTRSNKVVRHHDGGVAAEVWVESHRDDDRWRRG